MADGRELDDLDADHQKPSALLFDVARGGATLELGEHILVAHEFMENRVHLGVNVDPLAVELRRRVQHVGDVDLELSGLEHALEPGPAASIRRQ